MIGRCTLVALLATCLTAEAADRSPAVRAEFQRLHPCPANGKTRGACPGWERDHLQPLCAGGRDEVPNYQWLTVEEHREKTRRDLAACRGRIYRPKPEGTSPQG